MQAPDKLALDTLLEDLVAIPSESGLETEILIWCESFLKKQGFEIERQWINPEQFNLLAQRGHSASLLLYSHVDTVPPDPEWEQDPYFLEQVGDRLVGLGTSDMKAGLALILYTAQETRQPLKIALTVEEERHSDGAWALVNLPWFGDIQGILVPELSTDHSQETLGLGRRGLFAFELLLEGQAQHGALSSSKNPISKLGELIPRINAFPCASNALGEEALLLLSVQSENRGLSVPAKVCLKVAFFALPGDTLEQAQQRLIKWLGDPEILLKPIEKPTPYNAGYWQDSSHPVLQKIIRILKDEHDVTLPQTLGLSVADENVLHHSLGLPIVSLAPVGGYSHRAGEWVSWSSLKRVAEWYQSLVEAF